MGWIRLWDGDGTVPYEIYVNSTGYATGDTDGGDTYYAGDAFWIAPGNAPTTAGSKYYAGNYATETDDANADGTATAGTATLGQAWNFRFTLPVNQKFDDSLELYMPVTLRFSQIHFLVKFMTVKIVYIYIWDFGLI